MSLVENLSRIYAGTAEEFLGLLRQSLSAGEKRFVVTANPEILMKAETDPQAQALLDLPETLLTPDGVSVVKAMEMLHLPVSGRITGVDLAQRLLALCGAEGKTVCLLGAREEVVTALGDKLRTEWPGMRIYAHNGYDGDKEMILSDFAARDPDLVLVALGVPAQEKLIARHLGEFSHGVFMGVGGSFDVLSGLKKRAPAFFLKTNTEWLYRITREPSRLKRFYESNLKFMGAVRRAARGR